MLLLVLQVGTAGMERLLPDTAGLVFMTGGHFDWEGAELYITRSGYTGEDGFEISLPASHAEAFARALLAQPEVRPVGLGARNSLRLEAGLCLYGNDLDTTTTPAEAALNWAVQKVRRAGGEREGGFPGAATVLAQLQSPELLTRKRVGLVALERVPVREGTELLDASGRKVGQVTSGLLSPTLRSLCGMRYLWQRPHQMDNTALQAVIGTEPHTPWPDALHQALRDLGHEPRLQNAHA